MVAWLDIVQGNILFQHLRTRYTVLQTGHVSKFFSPVEAMVLRLSDTRVRSLTHRLQDYTVIGSKLTVRAPQTRLRRRRGMEIQG